QPGNGDLRTRRNIDDGSVGEQLVVMSEAARGERRNRRSVRPMPLGSAAASMQALPADTIEEHPHARGRVARRRTQRDVVIERIARVRLSWIPGGAPIAVKLAQRVSDQIAVDESAVGT